MKDFLFIYRADFANVPQLSPEHAQASTQKWMDWMSVMSKKGQMGNPGNRLERSGKVVKPGNVVTNGPYLEIKESVGGYSLIKAASYNEAVEIAKGCPMLTMGGSVEVREINPL